MTWTTEPLAAEGCPLAAIPPTARDGDTITDPFGAHFSLQLSNCIYSRKVAKKKKQQTIVVENFTVLGFAAKYVPNRYKMSYYDI